MATLKILKFTVKIFLVLNILVLCSCVDKSNLRQKYTDSQNMNIKSEVSFIIEREFLIEDEKEKEQIPSLIKFNRFGNIISSSKNNVLNSYDEKGNLIVRKTSKDVWLYGTDDYVTDEEYIKYYYNKNGFVVKEEKYTGREEKPSSSIRYILYDNNYIKEKIEYSNINDSTGIYEDSVITHFIIENKNNVTKELICKGKKKEQIISVYDKKSNLLSERHTKDLFVYEDTLKRFFLGSNNELELKEIYTKHDKNEVVKYDYDINGNCTYAALIDSTHNKEVNFYFKYQYDEKSNWIKKECYNNLHILVSYFTREIEYFPTDENNVVDYSWENEKSPLEILYEEEAERQRKESLYLNDDFVLSQFNYKMKEEYSNYKIIGSPKITLRNNRDYYINFNCREKNFGYKNENITVKITINIEDDTFSFETVKGVLI